MQDTKDGSEECIRKSLINILKQRTGLVTKQYQESNLVSNNGTFIDRIHSYVRVHDSINEWLENGKSITRKKTAISIIE